MKRRRQASDLCAPVRHTTDIPATTRRSTHE
jgi:hypothetical protein